MDTVGFVADGEGQSIDLMRLSHDQTVDAINNLVLTFLNSQGREE